MEFFYPNWINDMWRIWGLIFFNDKEHFVAEGADGVKVRRFDRERCAGFAAEKGIAMYDTACEVIRLKDNASDKFLQVDTLLIMGLGLVAFIVDTAGGVLFAKFLNLFMKKKINPMIGAAGISAFPMSGRIVHKMALAEDPQNHLLMHSIGVNVSGQIASVIAGGIILAMVQG